MSASFDGAFHLYILILLFDVLGAGCVSLYSKETFLLRKSKELS